MRRICHSFKFSFELVAPDPSNGWAFFYDWSITIIKIEIIGKPVPASRPRVFKSGGRSYTKPHLAHEAILKQALKAHVPAESISETLSVSMEFIFPPLKTSKALAPKADLDNLCKLPLDVATSLGFWVDDYLVTTLTASKRFTENQELPRTIITIHTSPK